MSIGSYSDLVTAVSNWLARDDLAARVPEFIALAEAKFNRTLRCIQMENRAYATVDVTQAEPEFIQLPFDFQTMRRVRLSSVDRKPRLNFMAGWQMDEYRTRTGNVAGIPLYFTLFGKEMELCPSPCEDFAIEMVYRGMIPALSDENPTNWLIATAPDAYLYGTLLEAAAYNREDERIPTWTAGLTTALDGLNQLSNDMAYDAGPLQVRTSERVF